MKPLSTLICLLVFTMHAAAQTEWAPTGAIWHYEIYYNNGSAETYLTIESTGDTIINEIPCKILQQKCKQDLYDDREYYTYKDQDKVFVYDGTGFRVLYDFSLQPGNEWTAYGPSLYQNCDSVVNINVVETGFEEINGKQLKFLMAEIDSFDWSWGCGPGYGKISEKFGSYNFMFPQHICIIDALFPCYLRCYEDSQFGFFTTGYADSCTYEYGVGVKEISTTDNVKASPNPVDGILTITLTGKTDDSNFALYRTTGQLLYKAAIAGNTTTFDITPFSPGTYILKVYHDGRLSATKIIKK